MGDGVGTSLMFTMVPLDIGEAVGRDVGAVVFDVVTFADEDGDIVGAVVFAVVAFEKKDGNAVGSEVGAVVLSVVVFVDEDGDIVGAVVFAVVAFANEDGNAVGSEVGSVVLSVVVFVMGGMGRDEVGWGVGDVAFINAFATVRAATASRTQLYKRSATWQSPMLT